MKKLALILLPLLLVMSCDLGDKEEESRPYDGTWVNTEDNIEMVLSKGSMTIPDSMKFSVEDVDGDTIKMTATEIYYDVTKEWKSIDDFIEITLSLLKVGGATEDQIAQAREESQAQFAPITADWVIADDVLTVTSSTGIIRKYTKK